jgi:hypothetical protein
MLAAWYFLTLGLPLAFLVAPTLLRSWRLFAGYLILVGGGLGALLVDHYVTISRPDYVDHAAGAGFAEAMLEGWKSAFLYGLVLKAVAALLRLAFARRRTSLVQGLLAVLCSSVIAFASFVAVLVTDWQSWMLGRWVLQFAGKVAPYFLGLWATASVALITYPWVERLVRREPAPISEA